MEPRRDPFRPPCAVPLPTGKGNRFFRRAIRALALLLVVSSPAPPEAEPANLRLRLSGAVSFPDADPDLAPLIGPETVILEIEVQGQQGAPWTVTLLADSDLESGPDVIPISNVSWTASPDPPFRSGVLSMLTPVLIGSGVSHSRSTVSLDFFLQNSWAYLSGNYRGQATFTLSSP